MGSLVSYVPLPWRDSYPISLEEISLFLFFSLIHNDKVDLRQHHFGGNSKVHSPAEAEVREVKDANATLQLAVV